MDKRRLFDLVIAVPAFFLLSPLFILTALAVKLDSPGPSFFRQERVGRGGRLFRMVKFRTMRDDASATGPLITVGKDPRITRVGRILRARKIDEIPQLFNVMTGDMSIVGPRPEVERYVRLYTHEQRAILSFRPGITDPASIEYRNESEILAGVRDAERTYVEKIMAEKIALSLHYAKESTPAKDLQLILKTIRRMVDN